MMAEVMQRQKKKKEGGNRRDETTLTDDSWQLTKHKRAKDQWYQNIMIKGPILSNTSNT
jgi:hypothetical protein